MSSAKKNKPDIPLSGTLSEGRDPPRQEGTPAIAAVPGKKSKKTKPEVPKTKSNPSNQVSKDKPETGDEEEADEAESESKVKKRKRGKVSDRAEVNTTSSNPNPLVENDESEKEAGEVDDEGDGEGEKNSDSDDNQFDGSDSEEDAFNPRYNASSKLPNDDSDEDTSEVSELKSQNRALEAELAKLRAVQGNRSYKASNVNITANLAPERLQGLSFKAIEKWETSLKTLGGNGISVEKALYLISYLDVAGITRDLNAFVTDKGERQAWLKPDDREGWKTWPVGKLIQRLKRVYPEHSASVSAASALARVQRVKLTFHSRNNFKSVGDYMRSIDQILMTFETDSLKADQPELVKAILRKIKEAGTASARNAWDELTKNNRKIPNVDELFVELKILLNTAQIHMVKGREYDDERQEGKVDCGDGDDDDPRPNKKQKFKKTQQKLQANNQAGGS